MSTATVLLHTVPIRIEWRRRDDWHWLTLAAPVGIAAAVALAAFGLPPIDLHSPLHYAGVMDPLCGMTRAVRMLALGRLSDAWSFNPASFPLLGVVLVALLRAAIGFSTGKWFHVLVSSRVMVAALIAVLTIALWINQQAHATLLMR